MTAKMLKFDEDNLTKVAEIVSHFNPHATKDVAVLVSYMKKIAWQCLASHESPTYCGTNGFMLTSYSPEYDSDCYHVKASVDACCFHGVSLV